MASTPVAQPVAQACPYVGLQPYTEEDREYFFGRDRDQRIISSNLYASPLTVLYGASGVGKSSILRAGVVPHLQSSPRTAVVYFNQWQDPVFFERLKLTCLNAVEQRLGKPLNIEITEPFHKFLQAATRELKGALLILLDQFEEYFLYHPESDARSAFDSEFASVVNNADAEIGVVIALRDDWLSRLDRFQSRVPNLLSNMLRLEHLTSAAAEDAIRKPLVVYNHKLTKDTAAITIEDRLVKAVLAQVRTGHVSLTGLVGAGHAKGLEESDHIETTFLQLVMTRLWDEEMAEGSKILRLETYTRLGGAKQIVQSHLDNVMDSLSETQQEICAAMFRFLVTPKGIKIAHETADLIAFADRPPEQVRTVLETLSTRRILRRISPPERYEIFHDVLGAAILDWQDRYVKARQKSALEREAKEQAEVARRLRRWVAIAAAAALLALLAAGVARHQKERADNQASEMEKLANDRTRQADVARREQARAESAEKEALHQAQVARQEQARAESAEKEAVRQAEVARQEQARAESAEKEAVRQASLALSDQLALKGVESQPRRTLSVLLAALLPYSHHENISPEVEAALRQIVQSPPVPLKRPGHIAYITGVVFSPDGEKIATTASSPDGVRIWDASTGTELSSILLPTSFFCSPDSIVFSEDGKSLACFGPAGVRVWQAATGKELMLTKALQNVPIRQVVLDPSGTMIAVGEQDSSVTLWKASLSVGNTRDPSSHQGFPGQRPLLSPDGRRLATVVDKAVRVWDLDGGKPLTLSPNSGVVTSEERDSGITDVAFSTDGKRIAGVTASVIEVWDAVSGRSTLPGPLQKAAVECVALSPDGKFVAAAGAGSLTIWDASSGAEVRTVAYPRPNSGDPPVRISFSPGSTRIDDIKIALISRPGGMVLHHLFLLRSISANLIGPIDGATAFAFSGDDNRDAIALGKAVRLENASTGQELMILAGRPENMTAATFSPDGRWIATASLDDSSAGSPDRGSLRLWEASSGRQKWMATTPGVRSPVTGLNFSPNGKYLLATGEQNTPSLWLLDPDQTSNTIPSLETKEAPGNVGDVAAFRQQRDANLEIVVAGVDGKIHFRNSSNAETAPTVSVGHDIESMVFDSTGTRLAIAARQACKSDEGTTGDYTITILSDDPGNHWQEILATRCYQDNVLAMKFSIGGQLAILGSRGVKLWNVSARTLTDVESFAVASNVTPPVRIGFDFSPNGALLASATRQGAVSLWTVDPLRWRTTFVFPFYQVADIAISKSGSDLRVIDYSWNLYNQSQAPDKLIQDAIGKLRNDDKISTDRDCRVFPSGTCPPWVLDLDLIVIGNEQIHNLDFDGAITSFSTIMDRNAELRALGFDPRKQIETVGAFDPKARVGWLVRQGKLQAANATYAEAAGPSTLSQSSIWNQVCWFASLRGHATEVINACDQAVAFDPTNWRANDSRGVARACIGDYRGAIEDFQIYMEHTTNPKEKERRGRWIKALTEGQNPFTVTERDRLLNPS